MTKTHCDICDAETDRRPEQHIWANRLPASDPMRLISMTVTFHGSNVAGHRTPKQVDLCDGCLIKFVDNIRRD